MKETPKSTFIADVVPPLVGQAAPPRFWYTSTLPLLNYSIFTSCYLLCISSGVVSQALNSICTFLRMPPVLYRADKTSAGCTTALGICAAEVSVFVCVLERDFSFTAP